MSIKVIAHITAKPDTIEATRELLVGQILPTLIEVGCVTYQRRSLDAQRLADLAQDQQRGVACTPLELGEVALGHA